MTTKAVNALLRSLIAATTIVVMITTAAAAQGRGKGLAKKGTNPTSGSSSSAPPAGGSGGADLFGYRHFGSWLDDASVLREGSAWTAISFGHYRSLGGRQNDFPVIDAGVGLTRRAQFGVTVPYYRMHFIDGTHMAGLGDVYANLKIALITPGSGPGAVGLAVTPIVEIVNDPEPGTSRFSWGAPVSVELRSGKYRLFGSSGFFSRGSVFGSGAVETAVNDRLLVTAALTYTRSLKEAPAADALGLASSRSDVSAVAAYFLSSSMAAFGGVGRTLTNADGASFMFTGGVSFSFVPRVAP